jgi:predicted permease
MTLRDLALRVRALLLPRRVEEELDEELAFHLELETRKLIDAGTPADEAHRQARVRFGSVALAADACRDARGTAFVDTLARDIAYAFRTFRRAPLAAATIVGTVALGLGMIAVVFTFYNAFFLRSDAVQDPDTLVSVRQLPFAGARVWMTIHRPQYDAMRRDAGVFTDALGLFANVGARVEGRPATGSFVTGNFFDVLGVRAALGRTLSEGDDERPAGRAVMVLSHRGWKRLVAADPAAVGRRVSVNGVPFEIVGVMRDGFRGLTATPDYWAPLSSIGGIRPASAPSADAVPLEVIGRLRPGTSADKAIAGLSVWAAGNPDIKKDGKHAISYGLVPAATLSPANARTALTLFGPLFFAFGLILLIGCANVANLLLARGVARQREIGVRLSLGASRRRIIRQLLTENLLLAGVAAVGAFAVSRLILIGAVYVAATTFPPEMTEQLTVAAPDADWRLLVFLAAGAIASTAFFGLIPAFQATRLELVRTMRGEVTRDARPRAARNVLIGVQVGAAALLLISSAVFLRAALSAASAAPVLRTSDTVMIDTADTPARAALVLAVNADPAVAASAASMPNEIAPLPFGRIHADTQPAITVGYRLVSPDYFPLLDIDIVEGRGFAPAERRPDAGVAVLSNRTAHRLFPNGGAVGRVLHAAGEGGSIPGTLIVVGVVRDVHDTRDDGRSFKLGGFNEPDLYLPTSADVPGTSLTVRVNGNTDIARQQLVERLARVDPALGRVMSLRVAAGMETYVLSVAFWITAVLGGLALLLTLSGLFGVLSYLVERRTTEIGVRIALGATTRDIAGLVLSQSAWPVTVGMLAGTGLARALAGVLMSTRASSDISTVVRVSDPLAYGASAICIVAACLLAALVPALRAARVDPTVALRQD